MPKDYLGIQIIKQRFNPEDEPDHRCNPTTVKVIVTGDSVKILQGWICWEDYLYLLKAIVSYEETPDA